MKYRITLIVFLASFQLMAQKTIKYTVILRSNTGSASMWDGNSVAIWGFSSTLSTPPTLPAKILYAEQGDTVIITARNVSQGEHHTVHLHGLDVDTRNDGDPATSFWLSHMQDTTYTFVADYPGTYIYHCHVGDVVHLQMGMYGLIVVRAANGVKSAWTGGPSFDKDYKWLMTEIDSQWHLNPPQHDTVSDMILVPAYLPDYFLINGKSEQQIAQDDSIKITGTQGEKIYMRLANIGYFNNRIIFPSILNATILSSDGRPMPNAIQSDTLEIMPGERFEVMLNASGQFTGNVIVKYLNMNTDSVWNVQYVPVAINGYVGLNENTLDNPVHVFPNPTDNYLEISFKNKDKDKINFTLINALGQVVKSGNSEKTHESLILEVGDLNPGIYYLNILIGNDNLNKKIIIGR
ncbi:MAG: multicopper oxidase domain-containing protein [Bacteroidetes bacterium]|nr:multicopper oxidase domain-containing protein [Bacteroidota bacterium]HET6243172.1 multicopper oxidase domain-containing protein [Bacteroidia bacterium]